MEKNNYQVKILGVGGGKSGVYNGTPSTSWVLIKNDKPIILFDVGIGVTKQYLSYFRDIPDNIYISHNHSDHSGELPVILAVEKAKGRDIKIFAHPEILRKLKEHRLDELKSAPDFVNGSFNQQECISEARTVLNEEIKIQTIQSIHSETCYGLLIFFNDHLILSWSADSAFNEHFYDKLWEAPTIILDGRLKSSSEHAGFDEIELYISKKLNFKKRIFVIGYGEQNTTSEYYNLGYPGLSFSL
jgi:ribonuclease BN (tRNA processing enzyme)